MPCLERRSRRSLALLVLLSALAAPLAAQDASRADLAGWLERAWALLAAPLATLWNDGRGGCDPDGGACDVAQGSEPLPEGRGACDPDGGGCAPGS